MTLPNRPALSVVAPCYNEQDVLPEFLRRVGAVLDGVGGTSEVVLVDDGSRDRTWEVMTEAAARDPRIVAVRLMRNHGHQLALTAGLSICRGERILIIDADLQDPPELLPDMMVVMDQGADVVYGQRRQRAGESLFKRATAAAFYRLIGRLTDVEIPLDAGDFRLITRRVLDLLTAMPERHRFVRGMVAWIGGKQVPLPYDRKARAAGESKYPLLKMVRFATDGIVSFSIMPLKIAIWTGFIAIWLAIAGIIVAVAVRLLDKNLDRGWASLFVAVLFMGGIQLVSLGIIGEYLGRIYTEVKRRPLYIVQERLGFQAKRGEEKRELEAQGAKR